VTWAILPVKDLVRAKSRLAGVLAPHERRALAQAMVEDVLVALTGCGELQGVLMVSDDPGAELLAYRYGVELLPEADLGCRGLNSVIAAACQYLAERGVGSVMVVHSDIPLLAAEDIRCLLAALRDPTTDVVLSPDRAHGGTNVLLFYSGRAPRFHYGPGSCAAHREAASQQGLHLRVVRREGIALDIDEPADLMALWQQLAGRRVSSHTARFLRQPSIQRRLSLLAASDLDTTKGTGT
jgi:2-phospho-L-lactate guanylyltransferase